VEEENKEKMGEGHLNVAEAVHAFWFPLISCEKLKY